MSQMNQKQTYNNRIWLCSWLLV